MYMHLCVCIFPKLGDKFKDDAIEVASFLREVCMFMYVYVPVCMCISKLRDKFEDDAIEVASFLKDVC
jgi:hypothetical protein